MAQPISLALSSSEASTKPRLFALIIGIDTYRSTTFQSLRGAQADAEAFQEYLVNDLQVPAGQIDLLLNDDATRSNIVAKLTDLSDNSRIEKGDPIVIYYAGHGSEIPAPPGWEAGGPGSNIQMLVPYDYSVEKGVLGLPDLIIGTLINRIAQAKGDNITAIFDCCHSASGTRGVNDDDSVTRVRSVELPPASYDKEFYRRLFALGPMSRGVEDVDWLKHASLQSHMLIAACGASEKATESEGHGQFSAAFLKLMRDRFPGKPLRYSDILKYLDPIPSPPVRRNFAIKETGEPPHVSLILAAGSAHGICNGAEFAVYSADDADFSHVLWRATVLSAGMFTSTIEALSEVSLSHSCVAVQTKAGKKTNEEFRLLIPDGDPFHKTYKAILGGELRIKYDLHNIALVEASHPHTAHLQASQNSDKIMFEFKDERVTKYGFSAQFDGVVATDLDRLAWLLGRASHFYRELNRINNGSITGKIRLEFYGLEVVDEDEDYKLSPNTANLCTDNVIDLVIRHENTPYGIKLINESGLDFYPYLFYFDNSDLSITPIYLLPTPANSKPDIPLKKEGGTLTLGYGAGGVRPFVYTLRDDQNIDVGFLKLFLTTRPVDFSYIPQTSPFAATRSIAEYIPPPKTRDRWETLLIPIVQRRYPSNAQTNIVKN